MADAVVPDQPVPDSPFRVWSLARPVYVPSLAYAFGRGMMIPAIPLFAEDLGAALALIGLVIAIRGFGATIFDIPAGLITSRFGARSAMALGAAGTVVAALIAGLAGTPLALMAAMPLLGAAEAIFQISRLSFVAEATPASHLGRSIAVIGGTSRIGTFVGPIAGGAVGLAFGVEFALFGQAALALLAFLLIVTSSRSAHPVEEEASDERAHRRILRTITENRRALATAGSVALALVVLRQSRQILIPLWGSSIGLDLAEIGLIFGLSSLVDMSLFMPVGFAMDRWGRKWTVASSLVVLAVAMAIIPFTHTFTTFLIAGLVSGFGNGLSAGAVQVMGADLAPRGRTGEFLGVWRMIADSGAIAAPIGVGVLGQLIALSASFFAPVAIGVVGAAMIIFVVPETRYSNKRKAANEG